MPSRVRAERKKPASWHSRLATTAATLRTLLLASIACLASTLGNLSIANGMETVSAEVVALMKTGQHTRAADQMSPALAAEFGRAYAKQQQRALSLLYWRSAAFRNQRSAQWDIAQSLAEDRSCLSDPVEAYAWASQSAEPQALTLKAQIGAELSEPEKAFADARAAELTQRLVAGDREGWRQPRICAQPLGGDAQASKTLWSYRCDKAPDYPRAARSAEATGLVVVDFTVNKDGEVASTKVFKSAGSSREHQQLDRATIDHLRTCRFLTKDLDVGKTYRTDRRWQLY